MIKEIIQLLQSDTWIGISEEVEIAKGRHEIPTTWKQMRKLILRKWQTRPTQLK